MVIAVLICSLFGTNVFAKNYELEDSVHVNEIFKNEDGVFEQVIRVNEDGSFVTIELSSNIKTAQASKCSHPVKYLVPISDLLKETRNVGTSSCCFKYRSVTLNRCKNCKATVKTYGAWHSHKKHKYPAFKKTCKTCGYKKK